MGGRVTCRTARSVESEISTENGSDVVGSRGRAEGGQRTSPWSVSDFRAAHYY